MPINRSPNARLNLSILDRVKNGKLVPVISGEAITDMVLGGHQKLIEGYANYIQYPLSDCSNLPKISKFKCITDGSDDYSLKVEYLYYIKTYIYTLAEQASRHPDLIADAEAEIYSLTTSAFANRLGYPQFDRNEEDPLLVLANLPLPVYITTSYHSFLEDALYKAGKNPHSEICRWNTALDNLPSILNEQHYEPTKEEPLVYHLHGLDTQVDSLVLTEDDYLAHLAFISQGQGKNIDPIPARIRRAVSDSALIVLGFNLHSWGFRSLFWTLIKAASTSHKGVCCLQLAPSEAERRYLKGYLDREAKLEVYWGDIQQYTQELNTLWRG